MSSENAGAAPGEKTVKCKHDFVHLHLHSDYSLLDGACAISWAKLKDASGKTDIVTMAQEYGMRAVALTDHGVMGGCLEFHNAMKDKGIKPIIGCETYIAPCPRTVKSIDVPNVRGFHLILLAENQKGYHNLCKLISEAHTSGFYYKPRIDKELLREYHEGIIGMSACIQGEIAQAALLRDYEGAKEALTEYLDIFGRKNFYLEIMSHRTKDPVPADIRDDYNEMIDQQDKINRILLKLSRDVEVPVVATNDCHYLRKEHAKAHEVMLCIQTRTTMEMSKRMRLSSEEFYFKSGDEMFEIFGNEAPEAISNTLEVAERCNVTIGYENHYPEYDPPEEFVARLDLDAIKAESEKEIAAEIEKDSQPGDDGKPGKVFSDDDKADLIRRRIVLKKASAYLREICLFGTGENSVCGYKKKYGYDPFDPPEDKKAEAEENLKRMDYELSVINRTKYPSYFLCVWDFINWAKEHDIPVGPGRGSGAGSIVAYLSGITNIDPMKYDLLFERFLNPDRVSPPDFDTDFCERNRQRVIDYVVDKYGADSVSQIGTYGTLKAKVVLKDIARALGRQPSDGNMITKAVPDDPKMTLKKAKEESPDFRQLLENEPWVENIYNYGMTLEQLNRQMGIHACGVIICNQPLADLVPLGRGANDEVITQYVAPLCESVGLLKMDFLGLRTLTVIQDACDNVFRNRGIKLDMDQIPLDDQATFDLLNNGDTVAVFQLESGGMQNLCRKFGVENLKHIIALVAIYRPGPMQFIDLFVGRKKGTIPIEYDHPKMEALLKETYGIMLYQEQIMQVVQVLAGFSLGQADILRRAIGKKKIKDMLKQHDKFVEGCAVTNNIPAEQAEKIWENIKKFADYGFNKSHSAAYAIMSYRTAYLKANFRPEFMAAVMTSELSNSEKLTFLISECRDAGIRLLPPDVSSSNVNFTVDGDAIRFGLGAIKGFGAGVSQSIIDARKDGPFKSITDLLERTEGINSKALESLIRAGALDSLGLKRSQLVAMIDSAIASANASKRDKDSGQGSLFDFLSEEDQKGMTDVPVPDIPEFDDQELLDNEKALLGFYVSGHPLQRYDKLLKTYSSAKISDITQMPSDIGVKLGGMITAFTRKLTKKDQKPFAIFQLEDLTGNLECICYNKVYEKVSTYLAEGAKVFVRALTKKGEEENSPCALMVEDVIPLEEVYGSDTEELHIHLDASKHDRSHLEALRQLIRNNTGDVRLILCAHTAKGVTAFIEPSARYAVRVSADLLLQLEALLGENCCKLKAKSDVPQPRPQYNRDWKKEKEGEKQ